MWGPDEIKANKKEIFYYSIQLHIITDVVRVTLVKKYIMISSLVYLVILRRSYVAITQILSSDLKFHMRELRRVRVAHKLVGHLSMVVKAGMLGVPAEIVMGYR